MRLAPWFLPFALSAALLTTTGYVLADNHDAEGEQHEPLDDEALEEEYGIKAGSVKRDEETSSSDSDGTDEQARAREEEEEEEKGEEVATSAGEADVELEPGKSEERNPEAGTGGTGSPDDAIHSSEEENSEDDEEGTDDNE
ncbi:MULTISPECIES: hypothetical protein [Halomonadaceae]|uniref:Dishevelled C-terminal domain-containing protein n=1 Tax=Vreelandella titanicae TaxID=664683 RepID=A0A558J0K8_9GAMM|nr:MULTISPECIES: hypothetical protein [Halomonas]MBR9903833.1 hypothetical protein [Gammaproteobacteria bacterium]TVU87102.1 hypothetical protein FQP89_23430 [Halomonas titanicae]CEP37852.1 Putative uncharacterized protein [Halomonas sp. R57-5]